MKKSGIKFFDKIIALLLVLGGVFVNNSCVMYGMPYADYEIKGVVTNKANAQPIQNIRVIRKIYQQHGDTLYTDPKGKYDFKFNGEPSSLDVVFRLKVEDIDGEENGGYFDSQEIDVVITEADRVKKKDGWYSGKFVKTQNIELQQNGLLAPEYGVPVATFKKIEP